MGVPLGLTRTARFPPDLAALSAGEIDAVGELEELMSRPQAPCGTDSAYRRHLRDGSPVDQACQDAHRQAARDSRRVVATQNVPVADGDDVDDADDAEVDDLRLILDTLRQAFVSVAAEDPSKVAPIAREFRAAVDAVRGPVEPPKEMTLAEQLAQARAARAARAQSQGASA